MRSLLRRIARKWRKLKSTSRHLDKHKKTTTTAKKPHSTESAFVRTHALSPSASAVSSERTTGSRTRPLSVSLDACMRNALLGPFSPVASTSDLVDAIPAAWDDIAKRMNREQILPSSSMGLNRSSPFRVHSPGSQRLVKASLGPVARPLRQQTPNASHPPSPVILHHRSRWSRIESQPDLRSVYLHDSLISWQDDVSMADQQQVSQRESTPMGSHGGAADRNTPNRGTFGDQQFDTSASVKAVRLSRYSSSWRLYSSSPIAECHGTAEENLPDWPGDEFHPSVCAEMAHGSPIIVPRTPHASDGVAQKVSDVISSTESSSSMIILQRIDEDEHAAGHNEYDGAADNRGKKRTSVSVDDDVFRSKYKERRCGVNFGRFDGDYRLSPPKFHSDNVQSDGSDFPDRDSVDDDFLSDMLSSPTTQARYQDEYIAKLKRWLKKADAHDNDSAGSAHSDARASSELETEARESVVVSELGSPKSKRCSWRNSKRLSELLDVSSSLFRSSLIASSDGLHTAEASGVTYKTAASLSRLSIQNNPARASRTTAAIEALLEQVRTMRAPPPQAASPPPPLPPF